MKGFTFVELLVTVLIIGGLMLFLLPHYTKTVTQQHNTHMKALQNARNLEKQIKAQQKRQERGLEQLMH